MGLSRWWRKHSALIHTGARYLSSVRSEMIGSSCWRGTAAAWFSQRNGWRAASSSGRRWLMGRSVFHRRTGIAARRTGMVASSCACREKASSGRIVSNLLLATRRATWYDSPMPLRRADLPTDPDQLAELVLQLDADNERLRAT